MSGIKNWLLSSWTFFKNDSSIQDITLFDVILQCLSFKFWTLYLTYTAIRCSLLFFKYFIFKAVRKKVWRQAQLYLNAKVVGILLSQFVLVLIGYSALSWALVVLLWGSLLSSLSFFAYRKSEAL